MHLDRVAAIHVPDALVSSSTLDGPLPHYRELRREGQLRHDAAQELAAEKLQSLHHALKRYQPGNAKSQTWSERLGISHKREAEAPQGLYLFGPVGRGKSMLMDLFFENALAEPKRRVHFHAFMLEVHETLHRWREVGNRPDDVMAALADKLAAEATLLCFDEFHVVNIADAMIIGRLLEGLFERGVVVVATYNWAPDDLYEGGLQRERFLPFIDMIKARLDVLELEGGQDYRLTRLKDLRVYHHPLGETALDAMRESFARMADGAPPSPDHLIVQSRRLEITRQANGVAWFGFDELCKRPLGAADYLAIATHFNVVLIDGVPKFPPEEREAARRFMILIDALYEHRVAVIIAAQVQPEHLFASGETAIEFERTVSRLHEMQSSAYLSEPHLT